MGDDIDKLTVLPLWVVTQFMGKKKLKFPVCELRSSLHTRHLDYREERCYFMQPCDTFPACVRLIGLREIGAWLIGCFFFHMYVTITSSENFIG